MHSSVNVLVQNSVAGGTVPPGGVSSFTGANSKDFMAEQLMAEVRSP